MINLKEAIKQSLTLLEIEYVEIKEQNVIRMLGDTYGLIQLADNDQGFRVIKIIEKKEVKAEVLDNLDCVNFDLDEGEYYMLDNELWFEITIINDEKLSLSKINTSIVNFCNSTYFIESI